MVSKSDKRRGANFRVKLSKGGMKTLLLITYEYPPFVTIGAKRWGEMTRFLVDHFKVFVYTTNSNGDLPVYLPEKNIKRAGGTPNKRGTPSSDTEKNKFGRKVMKTIASLATRRLITIDKTIIHWYFRYKHIFAYFFKNKNPDIVISSSTPFSSHLYGYFAKNMKKDVLWIADVRDPISLNDRLGVKYLWDTVVDRAIDKYFLSRADLITTNSKTYRELLMNLYGKRNIVILYNGYMTCRSKNAERNLGADNGKLILYFAGAFLNERRESFELLCESIQGMDDIIFKARFLISKERLAALTKKVQRANYQNVLLLPPAGYEKVKKEESEADVLVSLDDLHNESSFSVGRIPGKIFEYLPLKAPILVVGNKDSDIREILNKTGRGAIASTKEEILCFFEDRKQFTFSTSERIKEFSRKNQTENLVKCISKLDQNKNKLVR